MRKEKLGEIVDKETIDKMLDELASDSIDAKDEAGEEPEKIMEPPEEPVKKEFVYEIPKDLLKERPLIPPPIKEPRLYGGIFSVFGLAFVILTVLALIATIIALRWDMWIGGASEETIGDHQKLYIYLGVVGIVVCAVVSFVDVFRHRIDR